MSEQMSEVKRVVSGCVVTKIIDNFQQIVPQEVFMEFHLFVSNSWMKEYYKLKHI
jgi:hypothetical protein